MTTIFRLRRGLGSDFDDNCFPMTTVFQWMIDWAADRDSDPTLMTTVSDSTSMTTVFRWMIGWMNSMTNVFKISSSNG